MNTTWGGEAVTVSTKRLGAGLVVLAAFVWFTWPWLLGVPLQLEWEQPPTPIPITRYEVCVNASPRCAVVAAEVVEANRLRAVSPRVRPGVYIVGVRACETLTCSDVTSRRVEVQVQWQAWRWVKRVSAGP
jgi:hypothetical protein